MADVERFHGVVDAVITVKGRGVVIALRRGWHGTMRAGMRVRIVGPSGEQLVATVQHLEHFSLKQPTDAAEWGLFVGDLDYGTREIWRGAEVLQV